MASTDLGLRSRNQGRADYRVSKIADSAISLVFPTDYDFTGWTAVLTIRAEADSTALLTITDTESAEGSVVSFANNIIGLLLKAGDLVTLPDDAGDDSAPWVGVWDLTITDTDELTTRLLAGVFIAEKR